MFFVTADFRELRLGEVRSIQLLSTLRSFFDGAVPTQTRAHRSDSRCQRISLRHLRYPATTCSTPMPRTRLWDSLLLTKPSMFVSRFLFLRDLQVKKRADERTRTADLESPATSDTSSVAGVCRGLQMRIFRGVSFPCLAACCTVLRSRWCQSGVKIALVAPGEREGAYTARTKAASLNTAPTMMHFRPSLFCSSEE